MGIRYTKLPDKLNIDKMIAESVEELYGTCPFCGERNGVGVDALTRWYLDNYPRSSEGRYDIVEMTLDRRTKGRGDRFKWVRMNFRCTNCGLEWQSDRYPFGLSTNHDIISRIMSMPLTGENSAMIVIQRDIRRMVGGQPKLEMKG